MKVNDIEKRGGLPLLRLFKGSIARTLESVFPEYSWLPWKFGNVCGIFWKDLENQRKYLEWLGIGLGIKKMEDWYKVRAADIPSESTLLHNHYGRSLVKALMTIYPEHDWIVWKFDKVPVGYWNDMNHRRKFMDWVGSELKVKDMRGWYRIKSRDIQQLGGAGLLNCYEKSLASALISIYPEHDWNPLDFENIPKGTFDNEKLVKVYLEWLAKELNLEDLDGWMSVSTQQLKQKGAIYLVDKYGGLRSLLTNFFPNHHWNFSNETTNSSKKQIHLAKSVRSLFPSESIIENFRQRVT